MTQRIACSLALCAILLPAACQPLTDVDIDGPATASGAVVGGRDEGSYAAVGYLLLGDNRDDLRGPYCGATLIAPNVAVTAAHCVINAAGKTAAIGFDKVYEGPIAVAKRVVVHPSYSPNNDPRSFHDVAVLLLEEDVERTPLTVRPRPVVGTGTRYVGYGRTTEGDFDREDGYSGVRKSASQSISWVTDQRFGTVGVDGGLCWGDSGGALVDEDGTSIYSVLADFEGTFYCYTGNAMIFTALAGELDFLVSAQRCHDADDFRACTAQCDFECPAWGYAEGECRGGWYCDGTCVSQTGCEAG